MYKQDKHVQSHVRFLRHIILCPNQPRHSKEKFAKLGDAIYEQKIESHVEQGNKGKFVAIDIETGEYELDKDELAAVDRLLARAPDAQIWVRRVGSRCLHHYGPRHISRARLHPADENGKICRGAVP